MIGIDGLLRWRGASGNYLVAHPWIDLISQGKTPEEALRSFLDALALMTLHTVAADGVAKFRLAPIETSLKWTQAAAADARGEEQPK